MRKILLALFSVAPACAVETYSEDTAPLNKVVYDEQMLCDQRACLLHRWEDKDRDGVADLDEEKVGTDPTRFRDRPTLEELLRVLPELPTFQGGASMLLVLPTFTPFGEEVFGGKSLLPAKASLLDTIGIRLPEDGSIDLTDGFTMTRSLYDSTGLEFAVPPWLMPAPETPDTSTMDGTTDAGLGAPSVAMEGHGPKYDFKIQSASTDGPYSFSVISYTDSYGNPWTVTSQSEQQSSYSSSHSTATTKSTYSDGSSFEKTVDVHQYSDEHGTETTTTTHTKSTDANGNTSESSTTQTDATSADGHQEYHSTETTHEDGTVTSESVECFDGACTGTVQGEPAGETTEEGSATAHRDPDYMEYVPSPEVVDAAMTLRMGPVQTVNPLDGDEQMLQFSVTGVNGGASSGATGPVSLYTPEALDTAITEPVVVHMPFGGDGTQDPEEQQAPAPQGDYLGGQCIYCNQDGEGE
jgi:hypothetical protein